MVGFLGLINVGRLCLKMQMLHYYYLSQGSCVSTDFALGKVCEIFLQSLITTSYSYLFGYECIWFSWILMLNILYFANNCTIFKDILIFRIYINISYSFDICEKLLRFCEVCIICMPPGNYSRSLNDWNSSLDWSVKPSRTCLVKTFFYSNLCSNSINFRKRSNKFEE